MATPEELYRDDDKGDRGRHAELILDERVYITRGRGEGRGAGFDRFRGFLEGLERAPDRPRDTR